MGNALKKCKGLLEDAKFRITIFHTKSFVLEFSNYYAKKQGKE